MTRAHVNITLVKRKPTSPHFIDRTGQHFGSYLVTGLRGFRGRQSCWNVRCVHCGHKRVAFGNILTQKKNLCRCQSNLPTATRNLRNDPVYRAWLRIRRHSKQEGIALCKRWQSFEVFRSDVGKRPSSKHQLQRIDTAQGFRPSNCRWATRKQIVGCEPHVRMITANGTTLNMTDWAKRLQMSPEAMRKRVDKCVEHGVDVCEAVTTPKGEKMPSFSRRPRTR